MGTTALPLQDNDLRASPRAHGILRFLSRWQNGLALFIVGMFLFAAAGAQQLAPYQDAFWVDQLHWADDRLQKEPHPPGDQTLLGTIAVNGMHHQMDVYTALVHGARSSVRFGLAAALLTAVFGVITGAAAAFTGGWVGGALMRITDALLAIPALVGVFLVRQVFLYASRSAEYRMLLAGSWENEPTVWMLAAHLLLESGPVLLGVILFSWMPYARLTHAVVLHIRETEFVQAARALGASPVAIVFRHVLPNSLSPAIVLLARDIGGMVLLQATFTYLGLGGGSEWGEMLVYARHWIIGPGGDVLARWWIFLPATLALALFGMGWNMLGDGLNEWLNPRTR